MFANVEKMTTKDYILYEQLYIIVQYYICFCLTEPLQPLQAPQHLLELLKYYWSTAPIDCGSRQDWIRVMSVRAFVMLMWWMVGWWLFHSKKDFHSDYRKYGIGRVQKGEA